MVVDSLPCTDCTHLKVCRYTSKEMLDVAERVSEVPYANDGEKRFTIAITCKDKEVSK